MKNKKASSLGKKAEQQVSLRSGILIVLAAMAVFMLVFVSDDNPDKNSAAGDMAGVTGWS